MSENNLEDPAVYRHLLIYSNSLSWRYGERRWMRPAQRLGLRNPGKASLVPPFPGLTRLWKRWNLLFPDFKISFSIQELALTAYAETILFKPVCTSLCSKSSFIKIEAWWGRKKYLQVNIFGSSFVRSCPLSLILCYTPDRCLATRWGVRVVIIFFSKGTITPPQKKVQGSTGIRLHY